MADTNKPELIEDEDLEDTSGGLPAIQKVREAAARTTTQAQTTSFAAKTDVQDQTGG